MPESFPVIPQPDKAFFSEGAASKRHAVGAEVRLAFNPDSVTVVQS